MRTFLLSLLILTIILAGSLPVCVFAEDVPSSPATGIQFAPAVGADVVYLVKSGTLATALSATLATYDDWAEIKYQFIVPQEKADVEPIGDYHGVALAVKLKNAIEKTGAVWAAGLLNPSLTAGFAVPVSMDFGKYDFTIGISFINYQFKGL